mmetsp:Transcript_21604/g.43670  ORF Transcript_21604/g.43670 Transcript_21604/m.43670 type:complete len:220 (-) Transcript_21604:430-1089(-)
MPIGIGSTGASRRVRIALRPSLATTFSIPLKDGYSSTISRAFFLTGVSSLARPNATLLPIVADRAQKTAPCITPPNSIPDARAKTIPPASKQNTLINVHASMNRPASAQILSDSAVARIESRLSFNSGFSLAKSSPSVLTRAALPPTRRITAPAATTKAVRVSANCESDFSGLPSSSSSGTKPLLILKFRRDSAFFSADLIWDRLPSNTFSLASSSTSS